MITPAEIAKQLIAAERERVAIAPFTDANPELDIATAYLAQRAFVQAKLDAGERVVGAKLGLTSKVKQQAMGVDAPLCGCRDQRHAGTVRCADRVERIHPSSRRARNRLRPRP